jgi:subtilisin-like proprotein convertase family protein
MCAEDCSSLVAPACSEYVCDLVTAQCELAPLTDGTACDDADTCTSNDVCAAGACEGAPNGTCSACAESEQNGTYATGDATTGCSLMTGEISVVGDVDCYLVDVPVAGSRIEATVVDTNGAGCPTGFDSYLRLRNSAGVQLAYDDDGAGGFATCSKLSSSTAGTRNLPAGAYALCVEEFLLDDTSPPYGLVWTVTAPACGNAVVEGAEQCEGGNVAGSTCVTAGFAGGTVACDAASCNFDTTGCAAGTCNGAQLEYGEACDGQPFCSANCTLFECPSGQMAFSSLGTGLPADILDNDTASSDAVVSAMGTITELAVQVDLTHTYDGDLEVSLTPPGAAPIVLSSFRGGTGENYRATVFSSKATASITTGAPPFRGVFLPEASLLGLNGASATGSWRLSVLDDASGDEGTLVGWRVFGCVQP